MSQTTFQNLYAKAQKALEGCEPLTPYETPAHLHDVDGRTLVWIFSAVLHYGFAQYSRGQKYRSTYLDCPNGPIRIFAKLLPTPVTKGPFVLTVGDVNGKPFDVLIIEKGLVLWQKGVRPEDVKLGLERLDSAMGYTGHGQRPDPILGQGKFRVKDAFANPKAMYLLKPTWQVQNIMDLFDEPEKLAVVETDGVRLLTLKGAIITAPPVNPETIDQVIEKQYSTRSRS